VFQLDLNSCDGCGGQVRVIASIEDPLVIGRILAQLERTGPETAGVLSGALRVLPVARQDFRLGGRGPRSTGGIAPEGAPTGAILRGRI
jgi:hypothetical protein